MSWECFWQFPLPKQVRVILVEAHLEHPGLILDGLLQDRAVVHLGRVLHPGRMVDQVDHQVLHPGHMGLHQDLLVDHMVGLHHVQVLGLYLVVVTLLAHLAHLADHILDHLRHVLHILGQLQSPPHLLARVIQVLQQLLIIHILDRLQDQLLGRLIAAAGQVRRS